MFLRIILNYILGYVSIKVEGFYIERFINICMSKNIFFWNMKREKSTLLYANVGIKEYKKIKPIAKKLNCKFSIEKKKGIPFVLNKYKKRKIFFAFLIIVLTIILICSNYIWNIEINGLEKINYEELNNQLEENGLKIGEAKSKIDSKKIIENIRLNRKDIAWMGISIDGTNAKVEVVEAKEKPEIINDEDFCNIVADKDCIITKINVQNGTAKVKVGDIVKKRRCISRRHYSRKIYGCNIC
ncbi:MAG: sporulation protein YqfD [Clostridia bacterium]|nr:sporulation protein YqfD [Clostridia bacterium]